MKKQEGNDMGTYYNGSHLSGNFAPLTTRRPKNWVHKGYKITVPFTFKWRHKIGKVECNCTTCQEHYQPWYGTSWYHSADCALMKHLEKRPQIQNLSQYYGRDMNLIDCTD